MLERIRKFVTYIYTENPQRTENSITEATLNPDGYYWANIIEVIFILGLC